MYYVIRSSMFWNLVFVLFLQLMEVQTKQEYRPLIHYSPRTNWMNDPNGLVYYDGEWHLFYQHYPREPKAKNIYWGHAVSNDLITWTELSIALSPEDADVGIWSGSVAVDWDNVTGFQQNPAIHPMIAIYTWQKRGWQEQHMAYSLDRGRTWTKYSANPILPLTTNLTRQDDLELDASKVVFRDPKVIFHAATGSWIIVISGGDHVQFHISTDLIHWSLASRFGYEHGSHAGIWECPDLIDFSETTTNNKNLWVLIVSIDRNAVAGGSGMQYFVGTFDGRTFENLQSPENINWLDYGPDFYAGITYHNVPRFDGRRIMISWMNNWQYAQDVPTAPMWRGQMAIPRRMEIEFNSFTHEHHIRQSPVHELYAHSKKLITVRRQILTSNTHNILANLSGHTFMLSAEFDNITQMTRISLRVRQSADTSEYTEINYVAETNQLELDRSHSGEIDFHPLFRTHYNMTLDDETPTTRKLKLQLIVDRCSVEAFVNEGKYTMTALIFPKFESYRMGLSVEGPEITLNYLELMLL